MTTISPYNTDRVLMGEVEYPANDPASGAFFQPDYKKNDDLKLMLDSSKDSLKLEAMKRIIGMIAKGRDASDLFPAVVKNVVSKNIEVKKLVYVYLVRYAEEQQDLALLSISTFQRALKDPNQLIRASALRVLSSIRVPMIVPIVMLAIRDSASDMSPYVRKTAAHAIPKLYNLDPEQKEELVAIIEKLLSDKAPLVVGSAAMAFSEVCGDRISLLHSSYTKLCSLLADVDEWGQLSLLNVLTVYAKSCFPNPNDQQYSSGSESEKEFYASDSDASAQKKQRSSSVDPDLRLLLRAAKPLLQSRNSGVVMATAQLFYHCGPSQELPPVAKAMVRLLRAPLEVQSVVLNSIASLTVNKPALFEPFLKSFFVRTSDPTHIKLLKLEILTNLATEATAPVVLREFQTYVSSSDKKFVAATIQAIGRLAVAIKTETETCLNGLLHLLSSKDECVVCAAVVVVKRVVGGGAAAPAAAVSRAARLLHADRLGGEARAAAVWLVAEHGHAQPRAAALLAHMCAAFSDQEELVKLQLLTLAMKLSVTQPATVPLCRYVLELCRYDASYDVRDRARMLRHFLEPTADSVLQQHAKQILMPEKPTPTFESNFKDRQQYTLGSLSQYLGTAAHGYTALPTQPAASRHAALRHATPDTVAETDAVAKHTKVKDFYSESESEGSGSSSDTSSSEESSEEEESEQDKQQQKKTVETNNLRSSESGTSDSESDSETSWENGSNSTPEESPDEKPKKSQKKVPQSSEAEELKQKSNLELLLELDEMASALPTLAPTSSLPVHNEDDAITAIDPPLRPEKRYELVSRVTSRGMLAQYSWARVPHLYSQTMCSLHIHFTNCTMDLIENIRLHRKTLIGSRAVHDFNPVLRLMPGDSASTTLGVDFADSIQPVEFTIISSLGEVSVSITPHVGELIRAVTMSESRWDQEQKRLRGMNECEKKITKVADDATICTRVFETANLGPVTSSGTMLRFAGRMMSSQELVLLSVSIQEETLCITTNCSNMAVASLLANDIANTFSSTL